MRGAALAVGVGLLVSCGGSQPSQSEPQIGTTASEPEVTSSRAPVAEGNDGEWFDVAGTEMFLRCEGTGAPTVVFEAGYGDASTVWSAVVSEVGRHTTACAYDRAGRGRSAAPSVAGQRDGEQLLDELVGLLDAADITGPFVAVGHSFGGLLALLFADRQPEVVGVVLVDSSHPDQRALLSEILGELPPPPPVERVDVDAVASQAAAISLGDVPMVVVTAGRRAPFPGVTPEESTRLEAGWQSLQQDLLTYSTEARQVVAENSDHDVHRDEPEVVVDAISSLLS